MVRWGLALTLVTAALVATPGCAGSDEPTRAELWGRSFSSTSVTENGAPKRLAKGTRLDLWFSDKEDSSVGWNAGCNGYGGPARVKAETLEVGQIGGTLIGCMPDLQAQDDWFAEFFASDPEWSFDDGRLTLTAGPKTIDLESVPSDSKFGFAG